MPPGNDSKLEKLQIYAYRAATRSIGDQIGVVEVMFNPQQYSQHYENRFSDKQGLNTPAAELSYVQTASQELSLELIIDGTGTYGDNTAVKDRVDQFIQMTVDMDGEIHQPPFLKVEWGTLIFDCRLKSVNVTYTLFSRAGVPLRAQLNTMFISDVSYAKQANMVKKSSPDLTHQRLVVEGDELPVLAHKIYNDPCLYLQLAAYNRLDNFRALKPGTKLFFPPVENK